MKNQEYQLYEYHLEFCTKCNDQLENGLCINCNESHGDNLDDN